MKFALAILLSLVTFFSACSTISKNQSAHLLKLLPPPIDVDSNQTPAQLEASLLPLLKDDQDQSLKWWARYQLGRVWAKSNPEKSCSFFTEVSREPGSPLAHLALLRSLEVCPLTTALNSVQVFDQIKEPWLRPAAAQAAHQRAILTKNHGEELHFIPIVLEQTKLQSQKVPLLKRAIELAQKQSAEEKIQGLKQQLYQAAPRLNPEPKEEDYFRIANDYRMNRDFGRAREYYSKIIADPKTTDQEKYKALDGIRISYKLEERTKEYIASTEDLAKFAESKIKKKASRREWIGKYHDAKLLLARTLWTKTTSTQALKVVNKLQKELKGDLPETEINWLLARISEEAGDFDKAVALLEKIDLAQIRDTELKQRVLWYKAWNMRRGPRWEQAVQDMRTLLADLSNPTVQSRTRYWLARTLKENKLTEEAKGEFETVVKDDPLGYYGILAARDLDLPFHALPLQDVNDESQYLKHEAFSNANDGVYFEWLAATGEHEVAVQFLDFLFSAYQTQGYFDDESLVDFLRMYPRVTGYKSLFSRINELTPEMRNKIVKQHPALLFPMPFKKDVEEASLQFSVEPEFVYSIMRQESSFDPHARSGADAFGLLQLIPKAAKYAQARAPNVKYDHPEDLYQPDVNIPLGAAFIADTMKRYNGQLILTAAAYNASEEAIKGWLKTRFRNDPTEFIEDIPYEETRTYVKLVLRNYLFYKRLNLREPAMAFPERCLQGLQAANP
jgi:soluble lytic murein transglycosylase